MNVRLKRARELAGYAVQLTKDEGLGTMLARGVGFVRRRCFGKKARYLPAKKVLEAQRAEMAGKNFENCQLSTISVLTPLYNTPEVFLRQFLDSFVNQTAPNGELCLADASDAAHSSVGDIVREYQTKYQHIVYKKIENKGIAANTNAAAELASGEYLALADHDDILAPHAMYTMGRAIRQLREAGEPDGFLYSDEALFTKKIEKPLVAHFKPDYAPDYLLCCNYICHLAVFRRELFEQVGGERPECDGSQDHDLFLRLIEQVGGAAHVPQVLYYWRVHEGSTSGGTDAKPYVAKAAKKALADHLERTGRTGTIEDGLYPSTYRVRWDIVGEPKVSILIPNKDHTEDLEKCLQSIWKKTTWDRFEVIVIENNSTDPATFAYYEKARQRYDGLKVVTYPGKGFNFSAINNFGRKAAEGDYLLLLNNDTEVEDDTLHYLCETLAGNPAIGAVCPKIRFFAPPRHIQFAGYTPLTHVTLRNALIGFGMPDDGSFDTPRDTPYAHGAAMMVRREVPRKAGPMPDIYFLYYEELDWSVRIREQGWKIAYDPRCTVFHKESATSGQQSPLRSYYLTRNRLLFAWRNLHGTARMLSVAYQLCIAVPKSIAAALAHGRRDLAKAIRHGAGGFFTLKNKTA